MLPFFRLAPVPDAHRDATLGQITVVLADDHAAMRESLRTLLDGEADLRVVAETDSFGAVLRHVRASQPDVLVLDLHLPGSDSGLDVLTRLRRELPLTKIVVLTASDDPSFARGALDCGAMGLVLKEMADSDLPAAVRSAAQGGRYVSPSLATRLPRNGDRLTPREQEVLRLIALGHTSVEIADKLGLSPRTIETHRARIHRKLALTTRAELVHYALSNGMLRI